MEEKRVTKAQELVYELRIRDAMTKEIITISPDKNIKDLRNLLKENRISGVPVVNGGDLVGVISIEDLIKALANNEMDSKINEKMTKNIITLYEDEQIIKAVKKFSQHDFGRFPIINRAGKLVGILTQKDIIKGLLKRIESDYHNEVLQKYREINIFEDIVTSHSNIIIKRYVVGNDFIHGGEASEEIKKALVGIGVKPDIIRRVVVATYEAEMNLIIHADGGEMIAEINRERIKIEVRDNGPGIPDIEKALTPGFSTAPDWIKELGFGAGLGFSNIKNCVDEMKLGSKVGKGTNLKIIINI
ncbi:MAG: CBS domain-containing protein [Actinobacteria bacterium]|nr:CBS domain-containing protein [Actinomycetota bacterium]